MNLESVADELYGASPDEFIERRTQRVAEARAARERPLAKSISQLRRPTRSAWMVNVLAREAPEEVLRLLDLGGALADAQQRGAGADLRRLSSERHSTLEALTRRATELAAVAGHAATEASRQEVSQTLQAALADPAVADLVRAARVTQPVTYAGFGPLDLFAAAGSPPARATEPGVPAAASPAPAVLAPTAAPPGADERPELEPSPEGPPEDLVRLAHEEAVREAAEGVEAAEQEAAQAVDDAEQATRHADELADQVETLREQLAEAEAEEREARLVARSARKRATQHSQALTEAQRALAAVREQLMGTG